MFASKATPILPLNTLLLFTFFTLLLFFYNLSYILKHTISRTTTITKTTSSSLASSTLTHAFDCNINRAICYDYVE